MPRPYKKNNNRSSGRREDAPEGADAASSQPRTDPAEAAAETQVPPTPPPTPAVATTAQKSKAQEEADDNTFDLINGDGTSAAQMQQEQEESDMQARSDADAAAADAAHEAEADAKADEDEAEAEGETDPLEGGVVGPADPAAMADAQQHARDTVAAEAAAAREAAAEAEQKRASREAAELAAHRHATSVEERFNRSQNKSPRPDLSALGVNSALAAAADPAQSPTYAPSTSAARKQRHQQEQQELQQQQQQQAPSPGLEDVSTTAIGASSQSSRQPGERHVTIAAIPSTVGGSDCDGSPSTGARPSSTQSEMVPLVRGESNLVPAHEGGNALRERSWPRASQADERGVDVAESAAAAAAGASSSSPARVPAAAAVPGAGRVWWCDAAIVLGAAAFVSRCL